MGSQGLARSYVGSVYQRRLAADPQGAAPAPSGEGGGGRHVPLSFLWGLPHSHPGDLAF